MSRGTGYQDDQRRWSRPLGRLRPREFASQNDTLPDVVIDTSRYSSRKSGALAVSALWHANGHAVWAWFRVQPGRHRVPALWTARYAADRGFAKKSWHEGSTERLTMRRCMFTRAFWAPSAQRMFR